MNKQLKKSGYFLDATKSVWHKKEKAIFAYSDGDDTEQRIHQIIADATDRSLFSVELMSKCVDWPTTYHLHPTRANLLRPLEDLLKGDVLEIGCGCGAITRYLGELGANVLCVEGSPRRAAIARMRTQELKNVEIVTDNFLHFEVDHQFDVITLIGVLEYARKYADNTIEDGISQVLKKAASYLKPNGKLLIAIENQLGLKYFAGFAEDHYGQPMLGIENLYPENNIVTFGRQVLSKKVSDVGLKSQKWWYPFPDYKLPTFVVTEQGAKYNEHFELNSPLRAALVSDYQYPTGVTFKPEQSLNSIVENELIAEMANSFLLVASSQALSFRDQILAVYYSTSRKKEYAKQVTFKKASAKTVVTSQSVVPSIQSSEHLQQQLQQETYVKGLTWHDHLSDKLAKSNWDKKVFIDWALYWLDALSKLAEINVKTLNASAEIDGKFIDAIPRNLIVSENSTNTFIDQEWVINKPISVGYLIFRGLLSSLNSLKNVSPPAVDTPLRCLELIEVVFNHIGFELNDAQIDEYLSNEITISNEVKGYSAHTLSELIAWIAYIELNVVDTNIDAHLAIKKLQRELEFQRINNLEMKHSLSWKLTKPVRYIENKIKGKS